MSSHNYSSKIQWRLDNQWLNSLGTFRWWAGYRAIEIQALVQKSGFLFLFGPDPAQAMREQPDPQLHMFGIAEAYVRYYNAPMRQRRWTQKHYVGLVLNLGCLAGFKCLGWGGCNLSRIDLCKRITLHGGNPNKWSWRSLYMPSRTKSKHQVRGWSSGRTKSPLFEVNRINDEMLKQAISSSTVCIAWLCLIFKFDKQGFQCSKWKSRYKLERNSDMINDMINLEARSRYVYYDILPL